MRELLEGTPNASRGEGILVSRSRFSGGMSWADASEKSRSNAGRLAPEDSAMASGDARAIPKKSSTVKIPQRGNSLSSQSASIPDSRKDGSSLRRRRGV